MARARTFDMVIFDCDGVLVDSEPLSMAVVVEVLAERGVTMTLEDSYRHFLGRSESSMTATLRDQFGLQLGPDVFAEMRTRLARLLDSELMPIDGIHEALEAMQLKRCVASSSLPERIARSLRRTRLSDYFGADVFSASMVKNGKPAPDLFLHAAARLDVDPAACLVIEDSPAGIAAAHSAGMTVFGFTGATHGQIPAVAEAVAAARPHRVFSNMRELPGLIGDR